MEAKICGVKDKITLNFILSHPNPPHFVGFIVNYNKSKRYVEFEKLKKLLSTDKKNSKYVAVLVKPSKDFLEKIKDLNFDYYQIYDFKPEEISNIKTKYNKKIITALTIGCEKDLIKYSLFEKVSDIILFDSKGYEKSLSFDHSLLKNLKLKSKIMVAGNIKYNDQLDKFIKIADIIDISGGLETSGEKDISKIDIFLKNLNKLNKRFVLMSNAPRPSKSVEKFLLKLKLNKILLKNIFTSGEAALQSLRKNVYGKNFYHLGPKRDNSLFEGFENNRKNPEDADFILCTGFLDNHEDSLNYHKDLLKKYIQLKMICTNPDLVVHRGFEQEYCAGTLAQIFKELGGKVIYFGKPHPEIYKFSKIIAIMRSS